MSKSDVNKRINTKRQAPLHLIVKKNDAKKVKRLLSLGAEVDITDVHNRTPLHYAAAYNRDRARTSKL